MQWSVCSEYTNPVAISLELIKMAIYYGFCSFQGDKTANSGVNSMIIIFICLLFSIIFQLFGVHGRRTHFGEYEISLTFYPFISVKLTLSDTDYSNCILALLKPNYYCTWCGTPLLFIKARDNAASFLLSSLCRQLTVNEQKQMKKTYAESQMTLFHFKKICGLINTLGCVSIHYLILQLMNTWHGENEMCVFFPSVLMLMSRSNQKSYQFHPFIGDKSTKQKTILLNMKIYRIKL